MKFNNGDIVCWINGKIDRHVLGDLPEYDLGWIVEKDGRQQIKIAMGHEDKYREIGDDVEFVADGENHVIG